MTGPEEAERLILHDRARAILDGAVASGALKGGWLLAGPQSIGKATTAFALAKAYLSRASALGAEDAQTRRLVSSRSHPDLVVLERSAADNTGRLRANILVDEVRAGMGKLFQTTATGRRAVIVDLADDLNVAAANAMLKPLEEPPAGTLFLLLSKAPGRLLPTIRSRCRKVPLLPVDDAALLAWLEEEGVAAEDARAAVPLAGGAPGRALRLATGEGKAARDLAEAMIEALRSGETIKAAERAGAKASEAAWPEAWQIVQDRLSAAAMGRDAGVRPKDPARLLLALDEAKALESRGTALNADRTQLALILGRTLRRGLHAGR